jgi:hypothetical protein
LDAAAYTAFWFTSTGFREHRIDRGTQIAAGDGLVAAWATSSSCPR